MKVRHGFVSNSSSSSFIMAGYEMSIQELMDSINDVCGDEFTEYFMEKYEELSDGYGFEEELTEEVKKDTFEMFEVFMGLSDEHKIDVLNEFMYNVHDIQVKKSDGKSRVVIGESISNISDDMADLNFGTIPLSSVKQALSEVIDTDDLEMSIMIGCNDY